MALEFRKQGLRASRHAHPTGGSLAAIFTVYLKHFMKGQKMCSGTYDVFFHTHLQDQVSCAGNYSLCIE